ncbi:MAG: hypothetical protein GY754_19280 [bacterium]|nr:hypothetical protein [bacterium]
MGNILGFENPISLNQVLLPPICAGILLAGALFYLYMSVVYKSGLYIAMTVLAFTSLIFVFSETMILAIGGWDHNRELSVQFHRLEQVAGAWFLFAIPLAMKYILQLNKTWHRFNQGVIYLGMLAASIITIFAFIYPDSFISISTPVSTWLKYEANYGRGAEGLAYLIRDGLIGIGIFYFLTCVFIELVWHKQYKYLGFPFICQCFAIYGATIDSLFVHFDQFYDFFPEVYFSRFTVGLTFMLVSFMSSVTQFFITTAKKLEQAHRVISISEEKYRLLIEGTNDCIFSLNRELKFLTANRASFMQLVITPDNLHSLNFFDLIYTPPEDTGITVKIIREKIDEFMEGKESTFFKSFLKIPGTGEPREFHIRFEHIDIGEKHEIQVKASNIHDDAIMRYLDSENIRFRIGNYLIAAEELSKRLVLNLPKFMDSHDTMALRIGLREMIINAIEHGNLDITFDEKTVATNNANYLELIMKRQHDPLYMEKTITIEFSLNEERVLYKITDEGKGFDYTKTMKTISERVNQELLPHGRGLTLANNIFDRVTFNEKGNEVELIKYFTTRQPETGQEPESESSHYF